MAKSKTRLSNARFDAMVEEAAVDCRNPSEQATGRFTMIEEHLKPPAPLPAGAQRLEAYRRLTSGE